MTVANPDPAVLLDGPAIRVTRVFQRLLRVLLGLVPAVAILYLALFQDPALTYKHHGVHQLAIAVSTVLSGFVTWVTWLCYRSSGEVFLRWVVMGLMGFTLLYAPHGLFTDLADKHVEVFTVYGPLSRVAMACCFMMALARYGIPVEAPEFRGQRGFWRAGIVVIMLALASTGFGALWWPSTMAAVRTAMESLALAIWVLGLLLLAWRRRSRSPLMLAYLFATALFAQASVAFLLSTPWSHLWWLAHAVFAAGFSVLSYGIVQAFHTTRSFADAYSQEDLVQRLRVEKQRADSALQELEAANHRLRTLATTDALTGAANRRQYAERSAIEVARAERQKSPLSLLALDLDRFKLINDRHGHQVGDEVLKAFVAAIKEDLRTGDLLARTGGEEFLILLPDTALEAAVHIAERLRAHVEALRVPTDHGDVVFTVSIGCAAYEGDLDATERVADERLYRAKALGRNRVCDHDDVVDEAASGA